MIFFNFSRSGGCSVISNGEFSSERCAHCGESSYFRPYGNFPIHVSIPHLIKYWPPMLGAIGYHVVSGQVKDVLEKNVTGCRFHLLGPILRRMDGGWGDENLPDWLPEPPEYFLLEPRGVIDFEVPKDEVTECSFCGRVKKNEFGNFKEPLIPIMSEWDGSDVMHGKRLYAHGTIVTPKFINVLREHGWHRQPWYGRQNRKTEALYLGDRAVPGLSACNIDSDTWYEDTVAALREKYPERKWS